MIVSFDTLSLKERSGKYIRSSEVQGHSAFPVILPHYFTFLRPVASKFQIAANRIRIPQEVITDSP
jgi:hypothetical protein